VEYKAGTDEIIKQDSTDNDRVDKQIGIVADLGMVQLFSRACVTPSKDSADFVSAKAGSGLQQFGALI
jgi:hypothetical protein